MDPYTFDFDNRGILPVVHGEMDRPPTPEANPHTSPSASNHGPPDGRPPSPGYATSQIRRDDVLIPEELSWPPCFLDLFQAVSDQSYIPTNLNPPNGIPMMGDLGAPDFDILPFHNIPRAPSVEQYGSNTSPNNFDTDAVCGPMPMFSSSAGLCPTSFQAPEPLPENEDRDADGEPDPEYLPPTSRPLPPPPYPSTSLNKAEPSLGRSRNTNATSSHNLSFPISHIELPAAFTIPEFPHLPPVPRDIYLYAIKRDATSKKLVGTVKNRRWVCSLCCVSISPQDGMQFSHARSSPEAYTNDAWRHLHHVHLKNDVRAYTKGSEAIDIVALLHFSILRACYEPQHDDDWYEMSDEEKDEINEFYSVYGRCRTDGPIIKTVDQGVAVYPRLMTRLGSFVPSWEHHFTCRNCQSPIGRDWDYSWKRHPPIHCNGRNRPLAPDEFIPWPRHAEIPRASAPKRPRASPDKSYVESSRKRRRV